MNRRLRQEGHNLLHLDNIPAFGKVIKFDIGTVSFFMGDNLAHRIQKVSLMNASVIEVYAVTVRDFGYRVIQRWTDRRERHRRFARTAAHGNFAGAGFHRDAAGT